MCLCQGHRFMQCHPIFKLCTSPGHKVTDWLIQD